MAQANRAEQQLDDTKRGAVSGTFPSRRRNVQEEDHRTLHERLARLATEDPLELTMRLLDLRSFLLRHFAREEGDGGFFEMVLEHTYRFEGRVEQLRAEHDEILLLLSALLDNTKHAQGTAIDGEAVALRNELLALLRRHEGMENELLQTVMQQDFGEGD